jgi:hypothetical protein
VPVVVRGRIAPSHGRGCRHLFGGGAVGRWLDPSSGAVPVQMCTQVTFQTAQEGIAASRQNLQQERSEACRTRRLIPPFEQILHKM